MKLFKTHKKAVVVSLALTVAILGGGTAFAYFTSHGSGAGSAKVGTASTLTISQVGAGYDSIDPDVAITPRTMLLRAPSLESLVIRSHSPPLTHRISPL